MHMSCEEGVLVAIFEVVTSNIVLELALVHVVWRLVVRRSACEVGVDAI